VNSAASTKGFRIVRNAVSTTAEQSIPVQVAFPRNNYTLDRKAIRQLEEVAASIASAPERPASIVVEGHTCACGSAAANIELGRRRAEAVRDFLIARGVAPAVNITTISYGSSRPVESAGAPNLLAAVCERDAIHSENRRVVILLYGAVANSSSPPPPLDVSFLSRRPWAASFESLSDGGVVRTDDEYKIRLRAREPVYVYVFHRQANATWIALTPEAASVAGSASHAILVDSNREVSMPTSSERFVFDKDTGVEETIVYSRLEPDKDLESLVGAIQAAQGEEFAGLRPPDLPDAPPCCGLGRGNKPTVENPPPAPHTPGPLEGAGRAEEKKSNEPPPQKKGRRIGEVKGIKRLPQLPPDPVAFVRFNHLAK